MIPNKYAYITGCLLFFIPWTILYWRRRDLRRAMLVTGLIGAVGSLLTAQYWTHDWWRPETITGTRIGVEDFLLGMSNVGIATVLYVEVFRKRLYKAKTLEHSKSLILLVFMACLLFYVLFDWLHVNSFIASTAALATYSLAMLAIRRDLLVSSFLNGCLMVLLAAPIYFIVALLSPHIVQATYTFPLAIHARIFGIPVQEFVFYYIFGFTAAIMYEYWHGLRPRKFAVARAVSKSNKQT